MKRVFGQCSEDNDDCSNTAVLHYLYFNYGSVITRVLSCERHSCICGWTFTRWVYGIPGRL